MPINSDRLYFDFLYGRTDHNNSYLHISYRKRSHDEDKYLSEVQEQYDHITTCEGCSKKGYNETIVLHTWALYAAQ